MADLEISRNVPATQLGEALPKPYHRTVQAEVTHFPDIQSAGMQYGSATNWMSALGSEVAARASNEIASKIGTELGKNPQGDLGYSVTEFDKVMKENYKMQAQATLGLQAHKLITDTNLELAKSPRLSPDMIAKTQGNVMDGLGQILKNAPDEIKPHLQYQFGNQMINQSAQLTERMINEQRTDQKNNIDLASKTNAEQAYSLAYSGNQKAADELIKSTERINQAGHNARVTTPEAAKVAVDSVRLSALKGRVTREYEEARKAGKDTAYLKNFADNKPSYISNIDYLPISNHLISYVGQQASLRAQDENLKLAQFSTAIMQDPLNAGSQLQALKDAISPLAFEKANLHYLTSMKAYNKEQRENTDAQSAWSQNDAGLFNRQPDKAKDKAFDNNVAAYIKSNNVSRDEAEMVVAASAPSAIPAYIKTLNGKGQSSNPADLESLGKSISYLRDAKKGANLKGLDENAVAASELYQTLRRSKIPQDAADITNNNIYNQSSEDKKQLQENWTETINTIKKDHGKLTYFSTLGGIDKDNIVDPIGYVEQAENLLEANFKITKGDLETAKKMTEQALKSTWGETYINGQKQTTFYPLENAVGLPHDSVGYIQDDIHEYVTNQLQSTKKAFDAGAINYYWEVEPKRSVEGAKNPKHQYGGNPLVFGSPEITNYVNRAMQEETLSGVEMKIHKHWRNGVKETFPLIIKADPWLAKSSNPNKPYTAGWDIVLGTKTGYSPLFREAPLVGQFLVYKPDVPKIRKKYYQGQGIS